MSDRAELLDDLVARHADAVVRDRNGLFLRIDGHGDRELRRACSQLRPAERLEAQLVVCVGRVRYQLAEKDLSVAVKGMHHQVKQLLHFGLKSVRGRSSRLHW